MIRTQIQLTESQSDTLKTLSIQQGKSIAELIRQGIELLFQEVRVPKETQDEKWQRALTISGKYCAEPDLSSNHDVYLTQSYDDFHTPSDNGLPTGGRR